MCGGPHDLLVAWHGMRPCLLGGMRTCLTEISGVAFCANANRYRLWQCVFVFSNRVVTPTLSYT